VHKLLERQIKKYLKTKDLSSDECQDFFKSVSDSYQHNDEDRELIERSLEISSRELGEKNKQLQDEITQVMEQTQEMEKLNNLMIGREIKMIELKKQIAKLTEKINQLEKPLT